MASCSKSATERRGSNPERKRPEQDSLGSRLSDYVKKQQQVEAKRSPNWFEKLPKELADEIKKEREKILSEDAPLHPVARGNAEWLNENGINAPSPHTIYVWLRKSRMQ